MTATRNTTATIENVQEQIRALPIGRARVLDIPVLVIAEDGSTRPVIAFDFFEDIKDGEVTGQAFVLVTGSPDDPHPMWLRGYFKGIAWHKAHDRGEA